MDVVFTRMTRFSRSLSVIILKRYLQSYPSARQHGLVKNKDTLLPFLGILQPRSRLHVFCSICLTKQKCDTSVPKPGQKSRGEVKLLDEDGSELGTFTKRKADDLALDRDLRMGLIDMSSEVPTYQLMSQQKFSELNREAREQEKELKKKAKSKQPKTLTINSTIEQYALDIKLKSVDKWIEKGKEIAVVINNTTPGDRTEMIAVSKKILAYVESKTLVQQRKTTDVNMLLSIKPKADIKRGGANVPPLFKTEELQQMRNTARDTDNDKQNENSGKAEALK